MIVTGELTQTCWDLSPWAPKVKKASVKLQDGKYSVSAFRSLENNYFQQGS